MRNPANSPCKKICWGDKHLPTFMHVLTLNYTFIEMLKLGPTAAEDAIQLTASPTDNGRKQEREKTKQKKWKGVFSGIKVLGHHFAWGETPGNPKSNINYLLCSYFIITDQNNQNKPNTNMMEYHIIAKYAIKDDWVTKKNVYRVAFPSPPKRWGLYQLHTHSLVFFVIFSS